MDQVNVWLALWAGFASFISPCCLPLYPSYLSYITGISVTRLKSESGARDVRMATVLHTLFFIAGFSLIFYSLGFGAGLIAEWFVNYQQLIRQISAVLIFLMGLFLLGVFQPQWLLKERKFRWNAKPAGYVGSLAVGMGFAAGWSPCVGPILSSILLLAATEPGAWFKLTTAYTVGFAVPFFVLAFFIGSTRWLVRYSGAMMKIGGVVMLVVAVLLYFNKMYWITVWLNERTPSWLKF